MRPHSIFALFVATILAGCSGNSIVPAQRDESVAVRSAVRAPASLIARSTRQRDSLTSSAYPISALAFPISALAFPISALAFSGSGPVPTTPDCASPNQKPGSKKAVCKAQINTAVPLNPDPNALPGAIGGIQPATLQYIYNLPKAGGAGQTVGIVVAYDDPNAESDLAVYRSAFGLPPCTTTDGCFSKIATDGTPLPSPDAGWSVETSLDVDAVSAICQSCKILVVEAASNLIPDLAAAADTAVAHGAAVVSNSYGVAEASDNVTYASHYEHPGVPMTAAAGDLGYGPQFPASDPSVTAVGGTSAVQIGDGAMSEVVWPDTGSGCSAFFAKPKWQTDTGCLGRTLNDVAMLADPADGISVYDSTLPNTPSGGWSAVGGTSLGAPLVAAMYALAAKKGQLGGNAGIYAAASGKANQLLAITSGTNGSCGTYLCNANAGYSGPAGNGVPWGVTAFAPTK